MRPVMHGDVVAAARVLCALPEAARAGAMARMLSEAGAGDLYRKRFGRAHPRFGNGSLMSAAARFVKVPEPGLGDVTYLNCLYHVITALLERRSVKENSDLRRDTVSCHAYLCASGTRGGPDHGRETLTAGRG